MADFKKYAAMYVRIVTVYIITDCLNRRQSVELLQTYFVLKNLGSSSALVSLRD
jgi:hypothetical protein